MSRVIQYVHHGKLVSVIAKYVGFHREVCLCHTCWKFYPEDRTRNCPIANRLYALNVEFNLVTPVMECPVYEEFRNGERKS